MSASISVTTLKDSFSLLSPDFLLHHGACPREVKEDGTIVLAVESNGYYSEVIEELRAAGLEQLTIEEVTRSELEQLIVRIALQVTDGAEDGSASIDGDQRDSQTTDVRDLAKEPPVIRYLNLLIREAVDANASDIHLESLRGGLQARFRIDGVLTEAPAAPNHLAAGVISRTKLLAELDIAEARRPQDGRIRVRLESRDLDIRVSTVPSQVGESVVLRLLDHGGRPVELQQLGMPESILEDALRIITRPHGMLLVTGPTGSGKTSTLYAALQKRSVKKEKIITVEDPVEYQLHGVTQVPVHRQAGMTFPTALRSILRQDPDVLMIGEMRDHETAEIAVQAALTGHFVFSTLHTTDALGAIPRLLDLGIPDYLLVAVLDAVIAQRLVRRVCDSCKVPYTPDPIFGAALRKLWRREDMEGVALVHGIGCEACHWTGYRGRTGVFEILNVSDEIRDAIIGRASRVELRGIAARHGSRSLIDDAWDKVKAGITTMEEVVRVIQ